MNIYEGEKLKQTFKDSYPLMEFGSSVQREKIYHHCIELNALCGILVLSQDPISKSH